MLAFCVSDLPICPIAFQVGQKWIKVVSLITMLSIRKQTLRQQRIQMKTKKKAMVMKNDLHKRRWNEKYFFLNLEILPLNIRGYISTVSQINFVLQIMTNLFAWCMFVCLALLFAQFVIVIRLSQRHSREMYRKQRCKMVMCHHIYNTVQVEKIEWNLIAIEIAWLIEKRLSTSSQWWLLEITLCLFMFN